MQTDPIGYGDGMNWYNYVHGDPVNNFDPTGEQVCPTGQSCPFDFTGGSSGGTVDQNQDPGDILIKFCGNVCKDNRKWLTAPTNPFQQPAWMNPLDQLAPPPPPPSLEDLPVATPAPCVGKAFSNFFKDNYGPALAVANQYDVAVSSLLGLASAESGHGTSSMYRLSNNPFGATPGGFSTPGIPYNSFSSAWQNWGNQWGSRVQGVGDDVGAFINNLAETTAARGPYNTQDESSGGDPKWVPKTEGGIAGVKKRLSNWLNSGC